MKLFMVHVIKLFLAIFAIAFFLQWMADSGLKQLPNSKFEDWQDLFAGKIDSDVVILGSSRACVNYDPSIIEGELNLSTFNLGFNAASYNIQKTKYQWFIENNETPKIIIQNIDLSHFKPSSQVPDPNQFLPFLNRNDVADFIANYETPLSKFKEIPLVKYNSNSNFFLAGLRSFFGFNKEVFVSYDGFVPVDKTYSPDVYNLRRLQETTLAPIVLDKDFYNVTKDAIVQSRSSKVIFVWAPIFKERRVLIEERLKIYKEGIQKIAAKNKNIFFLDYSEDTMAQDATFFYDSFHLNRKGALRFSKMLGKDINKFVTN